VADKMMKKIDFLIKKIKKKKKKKILSSVKEEMIHLKKEKETLEEENRSLEQDNEKLKDHVLKMETRINKLSDEIEQLKRKEDTKAVETECSNKETLFEREEFDACTEMYVSVADAIFACKSIKNLVERFGISHEKGRDNISNLVRIIGMIGNGTSFANIICSYYENQNIALGREEISFFDVLNTFYRDVYRLDYDVLFCPYIGVENAKFDKQTMKDNEKRTAVYQYYDKVYVPGMMRNKNFVERMAIVNGYN
jgi:regulator of replication initiation timing